MFLVARVLLSLCIWCKEINKLFSDQFKYLGINITAIVSSQKSFSIVINGVNGQMLVYSVAQVWGWCVSSITISPPSFHAGYKYWMKRSDYDPSNIVRENLVHTLAPGSRELPPGAWPGEYTDTGREGNGEYIRSNVLLLPTLLNTFTRLHSQPRLCARDAIMILSFIVRIWNLVLSGIDRWRTKNHSFHQFNYIGKSSLAALFNLPQWK